MNRSGFDRVNHDWTMRFLEHRVKDRRVLRLIKRMLNAGVMEDGLVRASEEGTPQGSILSPLLSNIYLHYVLDLWFARRAKRRCKGEAYYFRFADDFLACFQYKEDAERFKEWLGDRLEGFALELAEEKTRCLEFGRFAATHAARRGKRPETFTFLGFLHYCGRTQAGRFKLKRRTNGKKLRQSLQRFDEWVRKARCRLPKGELLRQARVRVVGHIRYYGITENTNFVLQHRETPAYSTKTTGPACNPLEAGRDALYRRSRFRIVGLKPGSSISIEAPPF